MRSGTDRAKTLKIYVLCGSSCGFENKKFIAIILFVKRPPKTFSRCGSGIENEVYSIIVALFFHVIFKRAYLLSDDINKSFFQG